MSFIDLYPKQIGFIIDVDKNIYQRFKGFLFRNGISASELIYHFIKLIVTNDPKIKPILEDCKKFKLELQKMKLEKKGGIADDFAKRITVTELYNLMEKESPLLKKKERL